MTNQQVKRLGEKAPVVYQSPHGEVSLTTRVVQQMWCPQATEMEAYAFMQVCRSYRLNPFIREVYLIKYDKTAPAQIVIGKAAYLGRAEMDPDYDGAQDGIVVMRDGREEYIEGTLVPAGATLIGGWCSVYRKSRRFAIRKVVSMTEYDRKQSIWREKPATMINKTAIVQAHRDAFPGLFANQSPLADEWMDEPIDVSRVDTSTGEIIDMQAAPVEVVEPEPEPRTPARTFATVEAMLKAAESELGMDGRAVCEVLEVASVGKLATSTKWADEWQRLSDALGGDSEN